ncbi:MAG: NAD(P)-binding protein [Lachnospiraceae bacterium]|nr:NAD(P)-binding protein [Lachnospiraceae bacterium]
MIRVQQLKLPISHTEEQFLQKIAKLLHISPKEILSCQIQKQSIDARKKQEICYVYTVDIQVKKEAQVLQRRKENQKNQIFPAKDHCYQFPDSGQETLKAPPVIVGSGPAGLFCAYLLAKHGYAPIIIERGKRMEDRMQDVEAFWQTNQLQTESNVQFGEGGAGTFSDGKLNTMVKDVKGRNREVLDILIRHGAPKAIRYQNKPHIGTDKLRDVIVNMRRQIEAWGGVFYFRTCVTDLEFRQEKLHALTCVTDGKEFTIETDLAVLAIGHSARDTFAMLLEAGLNMEAKSFAVGLRVEHPQSLINESQYGQEAAKILPAASYKLTANLENGRGVYSFCMCPGGYVVNASSEKGRIAVNGMSYSGRGGENANSAIIVTVTPKDFGSSHPLSGVEFQRKLEEKSYQLGGGKVPQQLFGDFEKGKISTSYGSFPSCFKGQHTFGALHQLFPEEIAASFCQGIHQFGHSIPGFDRDDAILSGVESRTSSPVRITRDETFESNIPGLYPCGEGAGYAGGILSAAMDGMKIAEAIAEKYAKNTKEAGGK